ncbi:MAG: AlpA family phage regulatory protein [Burkholderia multivorans]|nr:AlpA family phage regulatory protein [Burkholderia multivorans]
MSDLHDSSRLERPERQLRFAEVRARIGLSRSEIYRRICAGTFPASVKLALEPWRGANPPSRIGFVLSGRFCCV